VKIASGRSNRIVDICKLSEGNIGTGKEINEPLFSRFEDFRECRA
jgi:hypothetical protein